MKVGDIVAPNNTKFVLRSGASYYDAAVVVSVIPFILVSAESDMRWESTINIRDFKVVGEAEPETLKRCMRRLMK